jgi:thioester reductase-like protein
MTYFVTGATGFIGRHLVEELLEREGDVHVLVREGSQDRLDDLVADWERSHPGATERVKRVVGDLQHERLGVDVGWLDAHTGKIDHLFHLAAIYDMTASDEVNERMNVAGTRNAVALANAVAGDYKGLFREDMFAEGQKLPSAYHRTKYESEALVRSDATVPWRVYRPAVVVGHSKTGEMDKIDGPYYFFTAIQKLRDALPQWVPLIGPELGWTNIVPVDYVARAMAHIAHQSDLDGEAFHLAHPKGMRSGAVLNAFAGAAHAPKMALRIDKKLTDALPKGAISMLLRLPQLKGVRDSVLGELGIPGEVIEHVGFPSRFDTRDTGRALRGTDIEVPELDEYAEVLWDYWERNLDPNLFKDRSFEAAINGRTVVITGGSSGIGHAAAMKIAAAGGIPILVARGLEKLEAVRAEIEAAAPPTSTRATCRAPRRSTSSRPSCSTSTPRSTCSSTTRGAPSAAR